MSLKSRLLKNRETKSLNFAKMSADCDLLAFFREHKEFDVITAYSHDKIFGEKNGNAIKIPLVFSSKETYCQEVEKIARLYDCNIDKKNPQATISTPSNSVINILMPPIVEKEPFISILRKNKQLFSTYFSAKIVSSEMVAYFRDCISQQANIFIVGDASVDKTSLMNFMASLSDNNKRSIICGKTEKITVEKPCSIKLSQGCIKDITNLNYDNIFYSDAQITDLTQIFQLIISGHNGFVVTMSLKEDIDILTAIRNMLLLSNINLFEENADFMTSTSIDVVICVNKIDGLPCITKVSEMVKNSQNDYTVKDIFVRNNNGYHVSTGNSSRFFNQENSQRFLNEFLEEGHKHSYISGQANSVISNAPKSESKRKKLKEKLRKLKREKFTPPISEITQSEENTAALTTDEISENQQEELIQETNNIPEKPQTQEKPLTFFGKTIEETENEILQPENLTEKQENLNIDESVFNVKKPEEPSFQDILESSANEGLLASETDDFAQEIPKPKIKNILELDDEEEETPPQEKVDTPQEEVDSFDEKADISELLTNEEIADIENELKTKYKDDETEIIEEPQLFSEISDEDVKEYEQGILEVPDEDI